MRVITLGERFTDVRPMEEHPRDPFYVQTPDRKRGVGVPRILTQASKFIHHLGFLKREVRIGDHRGTQWYTRGTEWVEAPRKLKKENKHISHIGAWLKSSDEYCLSLLPSESNGLQK